MPSEPRWRWRWRWRWLGSGFVLGRRDSDSRMDVATSNGCAIGFDGVRQQTARWCFLSARKYDTWWHLLCPLTVGECSVKILAKCRIIPLLLLLHPHRLVILYHHSLSSYTPTSRELPLRLRVIYATLIQSRKQMASAVVTKQIQRSSNMLLHGNNIKLLRVPTVSCCYSTSRSICSAPSRFLSKTNNDGHNLGTKQSTSTIRPESVNLLAYQQQGLLQEDQQHVQRQLTIPIMMKAMPSFLPHKGITQPPFKFSNDSMSLILSKWQHGFITSKESLINSARRMLTSGGPSKKKSKLKKKSSVSKTLFAWCSFDARSSCKLWCSDISYVV